MSPTHSFEVEALNGKPPKNTGSLTISTIHASHLLVADKSIYQDKAQIIPPFSNYVSVKKNILARDDDSRTYIPYHGDDFVMNNHDEYAALEEKFERNKVKHRKICSLAERACIWSPFVLDFLLSIDLPAEAIIAFLADGNDRSNPPRELPKDLAPVWHALRGSHASDWKKIERKMSHRGVKPRAAYHDVTDKQLATACLASKAFLNVAGISIWQVVKGDTLAREPQLVSNGPNDTEARLFDTYTKLDCLVCNMCVAPTALISDMLITTGMNVLDMANLTRRMETEYVSATPRACRWTAETRHGPP